MGSVSGSAGSFWAVTVTVGSVTCAGGCADEADCAAARPGSTRLRTPTSARGLGRFEDMRLIMHLTYDGAGPTASPPVTRLTPELEHASSRQAPKQRAVRWRKDESDDG